MSSRRRRARTTPPKPLLHNHDGALVSIWNLPKTFEDEELWEKLGSSYPVRTRSKSSIVVEVESEEAALALCEKYNSIIFKNKIIGLMLAPITKKKLIVAFDLDEVLGQFVKALSQFRHEEYEKENDFIGQEYYVQDFTSYTFRETWKCTEEVSREIVYKFFESDYFKNLEPIPGARDSIRRLSKFCDLYVVTSRQNVIEKETREWIEKYFPGRFKDILFGNHWGEGKKVSKGEMCEKINADILVDDAPKYIADVCSRGMKGILFNWRLRYRWQLGFELPESAQLATNWLELERFFHNYSETTPEVPKISPTYPQFRGALTNPKAKCIYSNDQWYTYSDLLTHAESMAGKLCQLLDASNGDLKQAHIAFLVPPSFEYTATKWGLWRAGGVSVPLCTKHPRAELEYVIKDSNAACLIAHSDYSDRLKPIAEDLGLPFLEISVMEKCPELYRGTFSVPSLDLDRRALFIYTSGTTGKPKGAVHTHRSLNAQIDSLIEAWRWKPKDHILHNLPLHHIHGIVNVLHCCMAVGARCTFSVFKASEVWDLFKGNSGLSVYMAVPTIYALLVKEYEKMTPKQQNACKRACSKFRLMISGSAALPEPVFNRWKSLSGVTLLERYGMTEIGMGLSNLYQVSKRKSGTVGFPLPGVRAKIRDDGILLIKTLGIFKEYWGRPEKTKSEFTEDGWFITGDCAKIGEDGYFRILGRASQDILKVSGFKVSALEIERELLVMPQIGALAICGIPDETYGETIVAVVEVNEGHELTIDEIKEFAAEKLAKYKVPRKLNIVEKIPRNAMGKVNKRSLAKQLYPELFPK